MTKLSAIGSAASVERDLSLAIPSMDDRVEKSEQSISNGEKRRCCRERIPQHNHGFEDRLAARAQ